MLSLLFGTEQRSAPVSSSDPLVGDLFATAQTESGQIVTPSGAMRLAAVYSCIHRLASTMAQMPLHVLRKHGDQVETATDHPADALLSAQPNVLQSSYDWRELQQQITLAHGNGLSRIVRDLRGRIIAIEPLDPGCVSKPFRSNGMWYYPAWIEDEHRQLAIPIHDVIHIRCIGGDRLWGISPIRQHADTIGLGLAAKSYGSQFFGAGGRPSGILFDKTPNQNGDLGKQHRANLRAAWREAGIGKGGGRTALLPGDVDYKSITIPPEEAQFIETQKFNRSEIAGIYNVPAHMINDLEAATFSNISEQSLSFVRYSIMPWIVRWEQELNRKLFSDSERRAGYYVKFNLGGLLRGTPTERAQFYHYAITDGWMSRNEVRVLEDRNPETGLDEFLTSVNAVTPVTETNNGN